MTRGVRAQDPVRTDLRTPPELRGQADAPAPSSPDAPPASVTTDHLSTKVERDAATRDGVARLSAPRGQGNALVDAHLAAPAKRPRAKAPLLDLVPTFSETVRAPAGRVELPVIAGVRVEGHLERFEGVKSSLGETAHVTVDARLGKLDAAAFDAVHAALGGRSKVTFDAGREYSVRDFLPPALQALVNRDLELPEAVKLKGSHVVDDMGRGEDLSVGLTMNCHATAWEAASAYQRDKREISIFYGEMVTMDELVHDETRFTKLGEATAETLADLTKLDLRPGDVIQFFEVSDWARMTMLLHSAVYAGGGLFFEKPNTEGPERDDPANYLTQEETPYRLATLELVAAPISVAVEGRFRAEVHRPKRELEPAEQIFESSLESATKAWAQKKGRPLGNELVAELEQSLGGGIRAEHVSALATLDVDPLLAR
ncbi:hypothetical protein L6R52_35710 [Myxococcota bacterium]|nr:hypothetical protein [Myxococcota bacterium]